MSNNNNNNNNNNDAMTKSLTDCFNSVDTDRSGFIERSELEKVIINFTRCADCPQGYKSTYSDQEHIKLACENFMKTVDTNKDNKISLQEFIAYFSKKM